MDLEQQKIKLVPTWKHTLKNLKTAILRTKKVIALTKTEDCISGKSHL